MYQIPFYVNDQKITAEQQAEQDTQDREEQRQADIAYEDASIVGWEVVTHTMIQLTDHLGVPVYQGVMQQPERGSIMMNDGLHGTAWQRHFTDGKWHSTTGATRTFGSLCRLRNVWIVYSAAVREEGV